MLIESLALAALTAVNLGTAGMTLQPAEPAVPTGTVSKDPATAGSTEIGGQGTFAAAEEKTEESTDATELNISAGAFLSTGNAESAAGTGLGKFLIRRKIHQFRAEAAGNYGRATTDAASPPVQTVGNIQGMLRYDVFFAKRWSAFLMATARHDPFQGLEMRLNIDPGVAFYAIQESNHRLWFELGYDFQFDIRTEPAQFLKDDAGRFIDDNGAFVAGPEDRVRVADERFTNHAARLFGGYTNNLNEHVTFDTGIEYLQSVIDGKIFRLNWASALTAGLGERFNISTTFQLRYENKPLPGIKQLDTVTSVLLGVRLL